MSNTRGRQPIGFNQPPGGGTNYPFVKPSADIQYLLGDFFLSFDDLNDEYEYPLKVTWLYGFGTNPVSPPTDYPTPSHTHDILVEDANGIQVFNSTEAVSFTSSTWDSRLLILEWRTEEKILRCTQHTDWSAEDIRDGQTVTYDDYITPQNGVLQPDTYYKLPKRVKSIQVGLTNISERAVSISEGYNLELTVGNAIAVPDIELPNLSLDTVKPVVAGERVASRVNLAAVPGAGLGVYPGCVEVEPTLKTINNIRSNDYQNFLWDAEGCIRSQRPVGLVSATPREFAYSSAFLPSRSESASAIEVLNDCENCCKCDYFAQTYQGLKRQWYLYRDVANTAEEARDYYADNIDRWEEQKAIREASTVRVSVRVDGDCKLSWGVAHCNASKCCLINVKLRLQWLYYINGVLQEPVRDGFDCEVTELDGSEQCNGPQQIVMDYNDNGITASGTWDYADPYAITTITGRHCLPDCFYLEEESLRIKMWAAITWDSMENPDTGEYCTYPAKNYNQEFFDAYDPDIINTLDLNSHVGNTPSVSEFLAEGYRVQKSSDLIDVSKTNPFCSTCGCEGGDIG